MNGILFSNYTWYELWGPVCFIAMVITSYWYHKKIVVSHFYRISSEQVKCFYVAAGLFYVVKGSPIKVIANDFLFSAHVFELAVLFFIVLPLGILSLPTELLRVYFWHYRLRNIVKLFSNPWIASIVFNGMFTAYLFPTIFNQIQQNLVIYLISQIILLSAAFLMWWTIIVPVPEVNNFSHFTRVAYVFLNSIMLMPIGLFLILSMNQAHYPIYEAAAHQLLPSLSAEYDQQLGGGLLKAIQLMSYSTALFYLIGNWAKEEEEHQEENIRVVQGIVIHLPDKK